MDSKNLLKNSKIYYEDNDFYEIFSIAEDKKDIIKSLYQEISKGKKVLDAGCGTGKFLNSLEEKSLEYIGIDLSKEQLNKAILKSKKKSSIFINTNLKSIPLEDNSIDLIVSNWVLGTILDLNEREKCLEELKRVLKPNGIIILVENNENSEFEYIRKRNLDTRTKEYNNWILNHDFNIYKEIDTFFEFNNFEEAKLCFQKIYGNEISNRVTSNKIEHKIVIFKYLKK